MLAHAWSTHTRSYVPSGAADRRDPVRRRAVIPVSEWAYDRVRRVVRDRGGRAIARLAEKNVGADANGAARVGALLAAAPDLRQALQALVDALTNAQPSDKLTDQILVVEAIARAGRALMKAERGG